MITAIHDAAKSFNDISEQLGIVTSSTIRHSKKTLSQLQCDIKDLEQLKIDLAEKLSEMSLIRTDASLGFGKLEQKVAMKREAMNVCLKIAEFQDFPLLENFIMYFR